MAEERKGVRETRNAQKKWQITIVIKMAIWMIKGSLGLLRRRREWGLGRENGGGMLLMSGRRTETNPRGSLRASVIQFAGVQRRSRRAECPLAGYESEVPPC